MHQQIQILIKKLSRQTFLHSPKKEKKISPKNAKLNIFMVLNRLQYLQDLRNLFYTVAFARFCVFCMLCYILTKIIIIIIIMLSTIKTKSSIESEYLGWMRSRNSLPLNGLCQQETVCFHYSIILWINSCDWQYIKQYIIIWCVARSAFVLIWRLVWPLMGALFSTLMYAVHNLLYCGINNILHRDQLALYSKRVEESEFSIYLDSSTEIQS